MPEPKYTRDDFHGFTDFLDFLLSDELYSGFVSALRQKPDESFHSEMRWHSIEELLNPFPEAKRALQGFAFLGWDPDFGFSACNLKACYLPDEDFVNGGRAFVLFNLIASDWTYVGQVANQAQHWTINTK